MNKITKLFFTVIIALSVISTTKLTTINVQAADAITMYRLYNPYSGEHFYTASVNERDSLTPIGWVYEGIGWVAPSTSNSPVYRLYNPYSGDHHYTLSAGERDSLVTIGWRFEGVGWYSDDNKTVPVYRQFNPNEQIGTHNYTTDKAENDWLVSLGWHAEDVGWYAVAKSDTPNIPKTDVKVTPVTPPAYNQLDPAWSGRMYGGYQLGMTGCGVTTMAMIISARTGSSVLPPDVADYLNSIGLFDSPGVLGTNGASFVKAGEHYGLSNEKIGSYDTFVDALNRGKLIAMQVVGYKFANPGNSHAIVVYGNVNGVVNVIDPDQGICTGQFDAAFIWDHRSDVAGDLDQGVPGFAF
jgi:hypothetical protein